MRDLYEKNGVLEKRERARSAAIDELEEEDEDETDGEDDLTTVKDTDREMQASMLGGKSFMSSINADKKD